MKLFTAVCSIFSIALMVSCTKGGGLDAVNGDRYSVTSTASSKQLLPAIDTSSTGSFTGSYDAQTNILTFNVAWNDLWRSTGKDTIASINFYGPASTTSNGALVRSLPLANTNSAGSVNLGLSGVTGFTESEKGSFLSGSFYFTVNTKRYPAGIVRGQLAVLKQ